MTRPESDVDFVSYPILHAISNSPMTARQLSRKLLLNRNSVYRALAKLEAQNLVVKRAKDLKWVPLCTIKIERPTETLRNTSQEAQEAAEEPLPNAPTLTPPPPKEKPYKPPSDPDADPQALRVSQHFRVPARISRKQANIGPVAACDNCQRPTPLRYGEVSLCPLCARKSKG
jgi:DNA-binding transcriptional MocR family regulator